MSDKHTTVLLIDESNPVPHLQVIDNDTGKLVAFDIEASDGKVIVIGAGNKPRSITIGYRTEIVKERVAEPHRPKDLYWQRGRNGRPNRY